jgi:copper oxidase (laccase) domain-containing protein
MQAGQTLMEFDELATMRGVANRFVLRQPGVDVEGERDEVIQRLWPSHVQHIESLGFDAEALVLAEQVHGKGVAMVTDGTPGRALMPGVDGLISNRPGRVMGIYVADCCAVYLADETAGSLGLVHSGKKGSELNIVGEAISMMVEQHGANPARMQIRLSPCIRPPQYEVDFAARIRADAERAGVPADQIRDEGHCTGSDLGQFYSYRREQGRTGRMLALLGWRR